MTILYDLVFFVTAVIHLPAYLLGRKFHRGLWARLGFLPAGLKLDRPIWVHAVSVGEAMMVKNLVLRLREIYPGRKFVISTVTATGNKIARGIAKEGDLVTYLPFDFSFIVRSVIDRIKPSVFIIAETELWPNLITCLHKRKIPTITVNGRISDGSFRGYSAVRSLIRPILKKITLLCVQTETDRSRLMSLGVPAENIKVSGNMKFDSAAVKIGADELIRCRRALSLTGKDKLLVCGSTHPREEDILIGVYGKLLKDFPDLKLLIAPRHPARAREIEKIISKHGFTPLRISRLYQRPASGIQRAVFILDTVGELIIYYAVSDVVFMGGSLVRKGGHNFLEPSLLEKAILTGPYTFNFRDLTALFLQNRALVSVKDAQELEKEIKRLLGEPDQAASLGQAARALILKNQGAVERNIQFLKSYLIL